MQCSYVELKAKGHIMAKPYGIKVNVTRQQIKQNLKDARAPELPLNEGKINRRGRQEGRSKLRRTAWPFIRKLASNEYRPHLRAQLKQAKNSTLMSLCLANFEG